MLNYADFYALMPSDNAAAIAVGSDVAFPQTAAQSTGITRSGDSSFTLVTAGVYLVQFQVSAAEAGQLILTANGTELPYTRAGRAGENTQIVGMALVQVTQPNTVITLRNASSTALTLTQNAGGENPVSAHLVIVQVQ